MQERQAHRLQKGASTRLLPADVCAAFSTFAVLLFGRSRPDGYNRSENLLLVLCVHAHVCFALVLSDAGGAAQEQTKAHAVGISARQLASFVPDVIYIYGRPDAGAGLQRRTRYSRSGYDRCAGGVRRDKAGGEREARAEHHPWPEGPEAAPSATVVPADQRGGQ